MEPTRNQQMLNIYNSLPSDIQLALYAPETFDIYDSIAERYALDATQREILGIQTGLLLMGLRKPKDFVPALADAISLPRDKTAFIVQEINRDILDGVKESLKLVHGLGPTESPAPTPTTPEPTATLPVSEEKSVLEQKLGGMFKVSSMAQPSESSLPTSVVPSSPEAVAAKPIDPYRELPM